MSVDQFRIFSWAVPIGFVLLGCFRPRSLHWTVLGAVLLFAALNAVAGIHILNHFRDSRWSAGGELPLSAPSFAETPIVGQYLGPLDSTLNGMVGVGNDFLAFKNVLPVAMEFLAASGWALLVSLLLAIVAAIISISMARRRARDFQNYRATVDLLKEELDQVKRQISAGNAVDTALPAEG
ncbi:hypothetical protein ACIPVK_06090 [Paeniglutamicibacter sp. MACA_103]|uniref:hypothetical protein n=1 Tax=Paeniglutamicibacter sp. MACA_103 TaxID=3377337 RepID=UPI003893CDC6